MPEYSNNIDLHVKAGADYTAQVFWWDDYDNPVPVVGPLSMEVRTNDANRSLVITCADTAGSPVSTARGYLAASDTAGLIEIFIPSSVTERIAGGSYVYDLFANYRRTLDHSESTPLWGDYHLRAVASGAFVVHTNVTANPTPK